MRHAVRIAMLPVLLLLSSAVAVPAQQYRGHLRGTILDPAGAPAPDVRMRITHESTGESRSFASGPDGLYVVADLMPGTYRLDAADDRYAGFVVRTTVAIAQSVHLDLHLGASAISMTADVRPTRVPVDRHSPAVTTRLDLAFLDRLPLERRDYLDAATLAAGVLPGARGVAAAGTGDALTAYAMDGLSWFSDPRLGSPPIRMPLDALSEFEVRTSTYDASFGRGGGAQVSVVTRSGTNRTEGGAYGLLQPDGEQALVGGFGGGALATGRTFGFGSYQFSTVDGRDGDGHLVSGRVDHLLAAASRLSGRFGLDTTAAAGHAQTVGIALQTVVSGALTNEVRFGLAGVDAGDPLIEYEASGLQVANVTTWARGRHVVRGGVDWYRQARTIADTDLDGSAVGLFVQDDWWLRPDLSLTAGLRYDHAAPEAGDSTNAFSPRLGVTWVADRAGLTLVRGGYGLARNHSLEFAPPPQVDQWSLSLRRSIGRARALEMAYVGSQTSDVFAGRGTARYNALQVTIEERSDANLASLVSYTYGKWTEDFGRPDDPLRAPLDARHRISAAFVASLPFGNERRWFTDGRAADILGNMQLTGIFRLQSGAPLPGRPLEQAEGARSIDVALVKTLPLALRGALELRLETYNLTDHERARGRRYQLGGRIVF
jgi:hypothetical protein